MKPQWDSSRYLFRAALCLSLSSLGHAVRWLDSSRCLLLYYATFKEVLLSVVTALASFLMCVCVCVCVWGRRGDTVRSKRGDWTSRTTKWTQSDRQGTVNVVCQGCRIVLLVGLVSCRVTSGKGEGRTGLPTATYRCTVNQQWFHIQIGSGMSYFIVWLSGALGKIIN